ncbi:MAG: T9SS type A sorting domain-containing protein, partial [Bacteroidota bacterium]|nr:T9SS type A sorting domain-containing protein [Bacteroidota bacterium]
EKVSDATTDNYKIINSTGKVQFNDTYSYLDVNSVSDSAFIRIELNWVSPDNQGIFPNGILLSSTRYWNIYSIIPSGFNSKIAFQYAKGNDRISDFNLSDYSLDSLVLLYRKKTGDLWMPVKSTHIGNKVQGFIISDNFAPGQYAIGVYDYINAGIKNIPSKKIINPVTIYPNPSNDYFNIILNNPSEFKLSIYDSLGNEITTMKTSLSQKTITWKPESNLSNGTYILKVFNSSQLITTEKIILTR